MRRGQFFCIFFANIFIQGHITSPGRLYRLPLFPDERPRPLEHEDLLAAALAFGPELGPGRGGDSHVNDAPEPVAADLEARRPGQRVQDVEAAPVLHQVYLAGLGVATGGGALIKPGREGGPDILLMTGAEVISYNNLN